MICLLLLLQVKFFLNLLKNRIFDVIIFLVFNGCIVFLFTSIDVIFFGGDYMRKFEKISFSQFSKDICNDKDLYDEYNLPKRATLKSAGYDFYAISDFVIHPGEVLKIPTGVKVIMNGDEALMLYVRSSMGFKYNVRLTNQVGVIDSDYYNNPDN